MSENYQMITFIGCNEHIIKLQKIFQNYGYENRLGYFQLGFNLNINDILPLIIAVSSSNVIVSIINNIADHYKKSIKVKLENGVISELQLDSKMSEEDFLHFISELENILKNSAKDE